MGPVGQPDRGTRRTKPRVLDTPPGRAHHRAMSGASGVGRVFIEDVRRNGAFLRVTWHDDARTFVVSNWEGDVCVGASRVDVQGAAKLVGLLTGGIAAAATAPPAAPSPPAPTTLRELLQTWWHGRSWRAPLLPFGSRDHPAEARRRSA